MKAYVKFLNVGWGDSHLIQLPSGVVTLIDGGDGSDADSQDHPLDWMNRNDMHLLDWMILTHIHEDHLNGLLDIAKNKKVSKAILPYEPFHLPSTELVSNSGSGLAQRVYNMLHDYLELVRILQKQGTEIVWRSAYASENRSTIWASEGFTLNHLYPWEGDRIPAFEVLLRAIEGLESSSITGLEALEHFFDLSNDDSSVYQLSSVQDSSENILFGGDQLEAGWERLANRTNLKSKVWKVSHHGMTDGFTERILAWTQPEYCIIPISVEKMFFLQSHWSELSLKTDAPFLLTGSVTKEETLKVYEGHSLIVQIGD